MPALLVMVALAFSLMPLAGTSTASAQADGNVFVCLAVGDDLVFTEQDATLPILEPSRLATEAEILAGECDAGGGGGGGGTTVFVCLAVGDDLVLSLIHI